MIRKRPLNNEYLNRDLTVEESVAGVWERRLQTEGNLTIKDVEAGIGRPGVFLGVKKSPGVKRRIVDDEVRCVCVCMVQVGCCGLL